MQKYCIEYEFPLQHMMEANKIHQFEAVSKIVAVSQAPDEWKKILSGYSDREYQGEKPTFVRMYLEEEIVWSP
ncbi:MAG: hypothetical protein AAGA35_03870 [Patescibacteria group bacterium]